MSADVIIQPACPNHADLGLDQACMEVHSFIPHKLDMWKQVEECYLCDALHWTSVAPYEDVALRINSTYPLYFYYSDEDGLSHCNTSFNFKEHGVYSWNLTDWNLTHNNCSAVQTIQEPTKRFYLPLLVALVVYIVAAVLLAISRCVYRQQWSARICLRNVPFAELEEDLGSQHSRDASPVSQTVRSPRFRNTRVQSLDTFRGICIALMVFVNYGGGKYRFFRHSAWNGITVADIVFPWFLWVMGMSLVFSLRSQLRSNRSRCSVWLTVLKRSVKLILLGLLLNSLGGRHNDVLNFRLAGVLQRIGMSYFIVATIETFFLKMEHTFQYGFLLDFQDGWAQSVCASALGGLWLLITFAVEVPGCGKGYIGPGGLHEHGQYSNCTGGIAGYIDRSILTPSHMYKHCTSQPVYHNVLPHDPEGILGTLTAAVLVHLGAHAGRVLLCHQHDWSRVARWLFWGVWLGIAGGLLCSFSKEGGLIPLNKNLFSLSFILVTASLAYVTFVILYLFVDVKNWWSGAPFNFAGMNAILIYVGHEITKDMFPWSWKPFVHSHAEFLAMNLWGTTLWIIISYFLYRNRIFLSV